MVGDTLSLSLGGPTYRLNGWNSSDADGDSLTYAWSLPPDSSATILDPTDGGPLMTVPGGGDTFEVQLIVNDGIVDRAPDTVILKFREEDDIK